jgi:hypothetical protein
MTDSDIKRLKDDEGMSIAQIEQMTGKTTAQVKHALRRARMKGKIQFEDILRYTDEDVENLIQATHVMQEAKTRVNTKQVTASIRIDETKPFGVAFSGDWHTGHSGVDYILLDRDLKTIRDTEGLYMIGTGDYRENAIKHQGSHFGEIISPGMQDKMVVKYMKDLNGKVLALVKGCHDHWEASVTDRDFMETLTSEDVADAVYLWHGGTITLKAENEEYTIAARHKFRFESSLNYENAPRRMMEVFGPSDVAAIAHKHNPFQIMRHLMGQYRVFLRSGTVKVWDDYGQQGGFGKGKPGVPVVIFYPNEHRMISFTHLRDGVDYLNAIRK